MQTTVTGEEEGNHYQKEIRELQNKVAERNAELKVAAERQREEIMELAAQYSTKRWQHLSMRDKLQQRNEKLQKKVLDLEKQNSSILYEKGRTSEELGRNIREKDKTIETLETKAKNLEKQLLTMRNRLAQASTGSSMSRQTNSCSICRCGEASFALTRSNSRKSAQQSG